jgi:hypothetical protein
MRRTLLLVVCALLTIAAAGQSSPPGYTPFDFAQQAKLRADVGSWRCASAGAVTPTSLTETEQCNWFVARAAGDNPATGYERWSHTLRAYVLITLFDSGVTNVQQTTSLDPDNATWTPVFPALDAQGRKRFDNQVSRAGDVLRSSTQFYDDKGNVQTATTTCTKQ